MENHKAPAYIVKLLCVSPYKKLSICRYSIFNIYESENN